MTQVAFERIQFQGSWPKELDPSFQNKCNKVARVFWDILSIIIFPIGLIRLGIWFIKDRLLSITMSGVPHYIPEGFCQWVKFVFQFLFCPCSLKRNLDAEGEYLLKSLKGKRVTITTADGAKLDGAFYPEINKEQGIIYAPGMAQQWESRNDSKFHQLLPLNTPLLTINLRGVGKSSGWRYEEGYALDLFAAGEMMIKQHHVKNLVFIGFSMGGAYSTKAVRMLKEKYPDINITIFNVCSYSSLKAQIGNMFTKAPYGLAKIGKLFARVLPVKIDVTPEWKKIKGVKYIFYNETDQVIPFKTASLYQAVKDDPETVVVKLDPTPDEDSHNRDFRPHESATYYDHLLKALKLNRADTDLDTPPELRRRQCPTPPYHPSDVRSLENKTRKKWMTPHKI